MSSAYLMFNFNISKYILHAVVVVVVVSVCVTYHSLCCYSSLVSCINVGKGSCLSFVCLIILFISYFY